MFHSKKFKPKFSPQKLTPMAKIYKRTSYVKSYLYHLFETFKIIKLPFVRKKDVIRNKAFTEKEPDPTGTISHTMWRCSCNRYLLLTEFGGRTVSYGPSFFFLDLWPKREAKKRRSVTYSTDRENEVSKIFTTSLVCV